MVSKEDLLKLGFSEKKENVFIKSYTQMIPQIMGGAPVGVPFILELTVDNSENPLGTYIEFRIDGLFGFNGYYTDVADLQKNIRLKL